MLHYLEETLSFPRNRGYLSEMSNNRHGYQSDALKLERWSNLFTWKRIRPNRRLPLQLTNKEFDNAAEISHLFQEATKNLTTSGYSVSYQAFRRN